MCKFLFTLSTLGVVKTLEMVEDGALLLGFGGGLATNALVEGAHGIGAAPLVEIVVLETREHSHHLRHAFGALLR